VLAQTSGYTLHEIPVSHGQEAGDIPERTDQLTMNSYMLTRQAQPVNHSVKTTPLFSTDKYIKFSHFHVFFYSHLSTLLSHICHHSRMKSS